MSHTPSAYNKLIMAAIFTVVLVLSDNAKRKGGAGYAKVK